MIRLAHLAPGALSVALVTIPTFAHSAPTCFGRPFHAPASFRVTAAPPAAPSSPEMPTPPAPRLQMSSGPLQSPPEIERVARGFVVHWVGGFINDGYETWSAIDLDRGLVVSIDRRVYDKRAIQTQPFGDPVFSPNDPYSYARKWTSQDRTEAEVVSISELEPDDARAFVCLANAEWDLPQVAPELFAQGPTDTLTSERNLLDRSESRTIRDDSLVPWLLLQIERRRTPATWGAPPANPLR